MITQEELKEYLYYDPEIGIFVWKKGIGRTKAGDTAGTQAITAGGKAYCQIAIHRKRYYAHRLAWLYQSGNWPKNEIDHKDGNGLNNRIDNLRCVTKKENHKNRRLQANNTSGFSGVFWNKKDKKWIARIGTDRGEICLGYFDSCEDAVIIRKEAEKEHGYHKNHGSMRPL